MPLDPSLDLTGDPRFVKVSASDVAGSSRCGRFLALKTRPAVKAVDGWRRLFSPWDERMPIPVVDMIALVRAAHKRNHQTYQAQSAWLAQALDAHKVHRLLRPYIQLAVDNVLEVHDSIEAELGPLRLLPQEELAVGTQDRLLAAWAPLYETADGIREIRRFRVGSARSAEESEKWSVVAAYVAATYRTGAPLKRVRVVEIGAADGTSSVLFDGTQEEARARFAASGRSLAAAAADEDHVVPCRSCGNCKAAGSCRALVPVDGMLGQPDRGHSSRSVSPSELEQYMRCPAQWLLDSGAHLPKEDNSGEGAIRGRAVHRWLQAAHARQAGCNPADLPAPGTGLGLADGVLTEADYELAYPFLLQHVGHCPLTSDADVPALVEEDLYGYDHQAEVVAVTRPDLVYRAGDVLVIREFKTAEQPYGSGRDEAYGRHLQIAFQITMLNSGLLARQKADSGVVELELLTHSERFLWRWDAGDPAVAAAAMADVRRAVQDWHSDNTWKTKTGPHCAWCPVRRWCPDSDKWQVGHSAAADGGGALALTPVPATDEPPF
jgi:hypothetical protein